MCRNYKVIVNVFNVPAETVEEVEFELYDILKGCEQLPYDYEMEVVQEGERL